MEPQDNNATQFTGTPQSESPAFEPKSGKGLKIFPIIAIVLILGLAAGLVFFFMQAQSNKDKVDTLTTERDAARTDLNAFREATGAQNPEDVTSGKFDLTGIAKILELGDDALIMLGDVDIKITGGGKYQIARHAVGEGISFWYRVLPNGAWKGSGFSSQSAPYCKDLEKDDLAAFKELMGVEGGVLTCVEGESPEDHGHEH